MKIHFFKKIYLVINVTFSFQSLNGIYVNGRKIPPNVPIRLNNCDKFKLAEDNFFEWRFEILGEEEKNVVLEEASQM